jgi:RNA-binding protein
LSEKKFAFTKELNSQQRARLKGLAHALKPVVQVGGSGLNDKVVAEIAMALNAHQLIKIQLPGQTDAAQKKEETENLIAKLPKNSHIVGRIGRMVILFLEKAPTETPAIRLDKLN